MAGRDDESPEFLAIAQILRSKRRAAQLLKGLQGQDFATKVKAAREFKKEFQNRLEQKRTEAGVLTQDQEEQRELLYVLRTMALSSFPHSPYHQKRLERMNRIGPTAWVRTVQTARAFEEGVELPFGVNARRVFMLLCTLAVEKQSSFITLDAASSFMNRMGWTVSKKGNKMNPNQKRYSTLDGILESFQKLTLDIEYKGVFSKRGKTADSFQIIKRFHLPDRSTDGQTGLLSLDEEEDDETIGPPGTFWIRMDKDFYEELTGSPERGISGNAFPFRADYLMNFSSSQEMDIALFLAARCAAAESISRPIDLHDIWSQLGIDPSNYSVFKKTFMSTLDRVRQIWDGCQARVPDGTHSLIIEPVPPGKEMVQRTLADTLLADFLTRETPEGRAKAYIEMQKEDGK